MDKNNKFDVKEILNNPQKKAQLQLLLIFIFCAFLFVFISANNRQRMDNYNTNKEDNKYEFNLNQIESDNYKFIMSIDIDNTITTYEGEVYDDKMLFNDKLDYFYKEDNKYYKKNDNKWESFDMNNNFFDFIISENVINILKESYFDSKVQYNDDTNMYNYKILTTNLCKLMDNEIVDIDDTPNEVSLKTDTDNEVVEISYDISSYSKYKGYGNDVVLNIKYNSFNEVDEISEQVE